MKQNNTIAILGGMGPGSSAYFYQLINQLAIKKFGAKNNHDFPEIILHSIPVPDFISCDKNKEHALVMLKERVALLSNMGISHFSIACNTAHILLDDLQRITSVPFTSMIEEVAKQVKGNTIEKIGLLGSPTTLASGIYQRAFEKYAIQTVIPNKSQLSLFENVIRNILAGKEGRNDKEQLLQIANSLKKKGAEGIILGCTELPLIFPTDYSLPVFNSLEILAQALLQKYYE